MDVLIFWISFLAAVWGLIKGPIFNPDYYIDYQTLERKNQGMLFLTAIVCALGTFGIVIASLIASGSIPHAL